MLHIMGIMEAIGMPIGEGIMFGIVMEGMDIGICVADFMGDIRVK